MAAKPEGFKVAPVIGVKDGTRFMSGPAVWETAATPGVVSIKFSMLGFDSSHQHDLLTIHSDTGKPYGVIRNVNSSGRLNGANVISGAQNRFTPDGWHVVEITLETRKGFLGVITDGKSRYQQKTGIENAGFTGISFANTVKLKDFSVVITPLPVSSQEEQAVIKALPELNGQINDLPESTPDQARKKTVLIYQLEKLAKAIEQKSFEIGLDIVADIKDGLTKDMGQGPESPMAATRPSGQGQSVSRPGNERPLVSGFASTPD